MLIDKELYDQVRKLTSTDYEPCMTRDEKKFYVSEEMANGIVEDLLYEYSILLEQKEDMEEYYHQHYRYVSEPNYDPDAFI